MGDVLLNEATVTGAESSHQFEKPVTHLSFKSLWVAGGDTVTAVKVDVEWSGDPPGTSDALATWFTLASHSYTAAEITALAAGFGSFDLPVTRVRGNLKTYTGSAGSAKFTLELVDTV